MPTLKEMTAAYNAMHPEREALEILVHGQPADELAQLKQALQKAMDEDADFLSVAPQWYHERLAYFDELLKNSDH